MATARRSNVRPISDVLADRVTSHEVDIQRLEAEYRRKARNRLRDLEADLTRQLERIDPTGSERVTVRQRRLEALQKSTRDSIRNSYVDSRREFKNDLRDFSQTEVDAFPRVVNRAIGVNLFDISVAPGTLRQIVDGALIQGTPLNDHWDRQARRTRERFESEMAIGVLAGEDLGTLRQRLRGRHTGRYRTVQRADGSTRREGIFEGGIMTTSRREADALIRTATQKVSNNVRDEMIRANADIVKGRQALVTLDSRTSDICIARSGHAWDLEGKPIKETGATEDFPGTPPWHVNCRTTLIPLLRSWAELAGPKSKISKEKLRKLDSAGRRTQASMDGQVAAKLNYEQWLKTKSETFQNRVLGKGKADLWRRGKITSLSQLVDQTDRPVTLREFRQRAGLDPSTGRAARREAGTGIGSSLITGAVLFALPGPISTPLQIAMYRSARGFARRHGADTVRAAAGVAYAALLSVPFDIALTRVLNSLTIRPKANRGQAAPNVDSADLAEKFSNLTDNGMAAVYRPPTGPPKMRQYVRGRDTDTVYRSQPEYNPNPSPEARKYFGVQYTKVTEAYRKGGELPSDVRRIVDAIGSEAVPLTSPVVAFRGMSGVGDLVRNLSVGDTLPSFGPFSSSLSPEVAWRFTRRRTGTGLRARATPTNLRDSAFFILTMAQGTPVMLGNTLWKELTLPEGYSLRVDAIHRNASEMLPVAGTKPKRLPPTIVEATVIRDDPKLVRAAPPQVTPDIDPRIIRDVGRPTASPAVDLGRTGGLTPVRIVEQEKWCGPCAISALTGKSSLEAANLIRRQRGLAEGTGDIVGTSFGEVLAATRAGLPEGKRVAVGRRPFTEGKTNAPLNGTGLSVEDWMRTKPEGQTAAVLWLPRTEEFHWIAASRKGNDVFVVDNGVLAGTTPVNIRTIDALTNRGQGKTQVLGYFGVEDVPSKQVVDNGMAIVRREGNKPPQIVQYMSRSESERAYHAHPQYNPEVSQFVKDYFGGFYSTVSGDFRRGDLSLPVQQTARAIREEARPLSEPLTLFRGMKDVPELVQTLAPGRVITPYGPFSTTLSADQAAQFTSSFGSDPNESLFLVINAPRGQKVVMANTGEKEVTIPDGYVMVVNKMHRDLLPAKTEIGPVPLGQPVMAMNIAEVELVVANAVVSAPVAVPTRTLARRDDDRADPQVITAVPDRITNSPLVDVTEDAQGRPVFETKPEFFVDPADTPDILSQAFKKKSRALQNQQRVYEQFPGYLDLDIRTPGNKPLQNFFWAASHEVSEAYKTGVFTPQVDVMLEALTDAAVPLTGPVTVFRGMSSVPDFILNAEPGKILPARGPFSTSLSATHALGFAGHETGRKSNVFLALNLEEAQPAVLAVPELMEVTIPAGYAYRVDRVHRDVPSDHFSGHIEGAGPATIIEATVVREQLNPTDEISSVRLDPALEAFFDKVQKNETDFRGIDLTDKDVGVVDITAASFEKAKLSGASLAGSQLPRSVWARATIDSADLSGASLVASIWSSTEMASINLSGAFLTHATLNDAIAPLANFSGASMEHASAKFAYMTDANFEGAKLANSNFDSSTAQGANFKNAEMTGVSFRAADVADAEFNGAKMSLVDMSAAVGRGASFYRADLGHAKFERADLSQANFREADLTEANFLGGILTQAVLVDVKAGKADFTGTNLEGVLANRGNFVEANFHNADLTEATLHKANFTEANISGAKFERANIVEATFDSIDGVEDVNFVKAKAASASFKNVAFTKVNMDGIQARNANFSDAIIASSTARGAVFDGANMSSMLAVGLDVTGSSFKGANLSKSVLDEALVIGAGFKKADLTGASIQGANLSLADFSGATLTGAVLRNSVLEGANLEGVDLRQVDLRGADLRGVNLSDVVVGAFTKLDGALVSTNAPKAFFALGAVSDTKTKKKKPKKKKEDADLSNPLVGVKFDDNGLPVIKNKIKLETDGYTVESNSALGALEKMPEYRNATGAAQDYFGSGYQDVTIAHRSGKMTPYVQEIVDSISAQARPTTQSMVVFRGIKLPREFVDSWQPGQIFKSYGPFSTALAPEVANYFGGSVMFVIDVPAGQLALLSNTSESELTIPAGFDLRMNSMQRVKVGTRLGDLTLEADGGGSVLVVSATLLQSRTDADFALAPITERDVRELLDQTGTIPEDITIFRANFSKDHLPGAEFKGAALDRSNFTEASLTGASFIKTSLADSTFKDAILNGVRMASETDISNANFSGANMVDAVLDEMEGFATDFSNADLSRARLKNSDFRRARFSSTTLKNADARDSQFNDTRFDDAILNNANFSDSSLSNSRLENVTAIGADFSRANLTDAGIRVHGGGEPLAVFSGAKFVDAILGGVNFAGGRFVGADFTRASLGGGDNPDFSNAALNGAKFAEAELRGADFAGAELAGTDFTRADIRNANLISAELAGTNFTEANITGVNFDTESLNRARDTITWDRVVADHVRLDGRKVTLEEFLRYVR